MIGNKRGIFFTTIVLVILTLFLISFTLYSQINTRKVEQKRVESLNNFLLSTEKDLERQLFTSSFRIIFLIEKNILEKGKYRDDLQLSFIKLFFEGKLDGEDDDEINTIMTDAKYFDILTKLNTNAAKLNANVSFNLPTLYISQIDPWNLKVNLTILLTMQDKKALVSWEKNHSVVILLPIEGFEDPTFPLESNDISVSNKFSQSPYFPFTSSADLVNHANSGTYIASTEAPSFIDRLEGNLNAESEYGIEALAVPTLASRTQISIVDHEYYSDTSGTVPDPSLPEWFYIDDPHTETYSPP